MKVRKATRKIRAKSDEPAAGAQGEVRIRTPVVTTAGGGVGQRTSKLEGYDPKGPGDARQAEGESDALVPNNEEHQLEEATPGEEADSSVDLSIKQSQAIMHLTNGASILETARLVGVDPSTIHRWRRNSFKFRAAFNANKNRVLEAAQSILIASSLSAAEVVSEEIRLKRNAQVALKVLERLGALSPPEIESEDHITLGVETVQGEWIKTISEDGLAPLAEFFGAIEQEHGETRKGVEKLIEAGLEPEEEEEEDDENDDDVS